MNAHPLLMLALPLAAMLTACDEGDIAEHTRIYEHGRPVSLHATLTGTGAWGDGYSLVLATFDSDAERYDGVYNISQQRLPADIEGRDTTLTWEVDPTAASVELCLVTPLRERIVTFAKADIDPATTDTVRLDAGRIDVSLYGTVLQLFGNSCTRCHGEGAAANLLLDRAHAHDQLVGADAYRAEFAGMKRVVPGDAGQSVLHLMLDSTYHHTQEISVNHPAIFRTTYPLAVIDRWISEGAPAD